MPLRSLGLTIVGALIGLLIYFVGIPAALFGVLHFKRRQK